ncbi:hypothetical protein Tco_0668952 [Tanacetum coccineum]
MVCSLPHTIDEIHALVKKLKDENIVRQKTIMELAVQFENASTGKDDLRKAYEKCNGIPQECRALIDTFLKQESNKDFEMNLDMYRKAAKIEKQIETKYVWLWENTIRTIRDPLMNMRWVMNILLKKSNNKLLLDEEALRETLEEQARAKK